MAKTLCPDRLRAGLALASTLWVLAIPSAAGQVGAMVLGGLIGLYTLNLSTLPPLTHRSYGVSKKAGALLLATFAALLILLPLVAVALHKPAFTVVADFYQAGALVFGGGHVVLPLLQASVVPQGWLPNEAFLAGYGAAQAVPGPLFTFAAYLGAAMSSPWGGWGGGLALLLVIFLPAFLLVAGALPYWESLRQRPRMQQAMAGVNAAVVGVLGAALYDPVWTSAIHSKADFAIALAAFGLLTLAKTSPLIVVILTAAAGWVLSLY